MQARRKQVLLVEDDPALQKLVRRYLDQMGLEVVTASDGQSALVVLKDKLFDLVCLDLMLPEVSGYDVCEHMRQTAQLKGVPVLMISARSLPEDRAHAAEVGVNAYLSKPFTRAQFTKHVAALLDRPPA
jgi:two-component system chemotaxis response regulator CheY